MATLTSGSGGFDETQFFNGDITASSSALAASSSEIVLGLSDGETIDLSGAFTYDGDGGVEDASTVNGMTWFLSNGSLLFTLTGLDATIGQLDDPNFTTADLFAGNDTIAGGAGDDVLAGYGGNNTLDGGGGTNTLDYALAPGPVSVDFSTGMAANGYDGIDSFTNFQAVIGSAFDDIFIGGPGVHAITGGGGNDTVDYAAAPGAMTADLSTGTIATGFGSDDTVSGIAIIEGGAGDDVFIGGDTPETFVGAGGNNSYRGGDARVTLDYSAAPSGIVADLGAGTVANGYGGTDRFSNVASVIGSAFDDTFLPAAGHFTLNGSGGANTLDYSGMTAPLALSLVASIFSAPTLYDGLGGSYSLANITVVGGAADDDFKIDGALWFFGVAVDGGGGGDNTLDWSGGSTIMDLNLAADTVGSTPNFGGTRFADFSTFIGTGDDTIIGGPGDHTIVTGQAGTDTVDYSAAPGDVTANFSTGVVENGFGGVDRFQVGDPTHSPSPSGIGEMTGGAGDDTFIGGPGGRSLDGGGGFNTLDFSGESGRVIANMTENGVNNAFVGFDGSEGDNFKNIQSIKGSGANDTVNDLGATPILFQGGGGNDSINGAAVTAVFTGDYSDYTIDYLANGVITVADNRANAPDGTDTLTGVSHLVFADQLLLATYVAAPDAQSSMWHMEDLPAAQDVSLMVQGFAGLGGSDAESPSGAIHDWAAYTLAPPAIAPGSPGHSPLQN